LSAVIKTQFQSVQNAWNCASDGLVEFFATHIKILLAHTAVCGVVVVFSVVVQS
jgi:hypothetical protein